MEAVGRAPVGVVVMGVRRARARAVMARVAVVLAAGASVAVVVAPAVVAVPVALVGVTEAAAGEIATRAPLAPASVSSPS
jgi:hypothetical protein